MSLALDSRKFCHEISGSLDDRLSSFWPNRTSSSYDGLWQGERVMRFRMRGEDDDKKIRDRPRCRAKSGGRQFVSSRADEEFLATVIRELPQAAISLQQALKTSESEGHP